MGPVNQLRREGHSREEAIELGGRERLRPILMTAATAVLALVPMAVGRAGIGGLYYYPLARTVIGGLTASTFLTVIILPFIYVLFDNLAAGGEGCGGRASPLPQPLLPNRCEPGAS